MDCEKAPMKTIPGKLAGENNPATKIDGEIDHDVNSVGGEGDDDEDGNENHNIILAQYKTESRVKSTFKFNLVNVVMFIDGTHYFAKELKASIEF